MNADIQMSFKNNYHVELVEANTGTIKQSGDFHNTVISNFYYLLTGANFKEILGALDVGSGTSTPSFTDTSLANKLWRASGSAVSFSWLTDYTARASCTYTFPATTDYVGTVTEVGLVSKSYYSGSFVVNSYGKMVTRALLTDSEGQIISFEKTDLDILKITVTVELTFSSSNDSFKIFKRNYLTRRILDSSISSSSYALNVAYGYVNLCRYYADMELANMYYDSSTDQALTATPTGDFTTRLITYPSTRLPATTITDERYFKAIALPGLGYWELPNEEIFPAYTISGISIGTGDGTTTAFTNPLCYFKAGTDKVYKNGVQLTRGVDYTINNRGNAKCLPEVAEFDTPIKVKSDVSSVTTLSSIVPFIASAQDVTTLRNSVQESLFSGFSLTFNQANPLYIEYAEATTFNCLKCVGQFVAFSGTNGYNNVPNGSKIHLDYSIDGVEYTELGSYTTTSTSNHTFSLDFADTTAKYWRLRVTTTVSGEIGFSSGFSGEQFITLNRKDPYITFIEAPADGDVLTMDVDMDVIMKNANFVVDAGCTISFQL